MPLGIAMFGHNIWIDVVGNGRASEGGKREIVLATTTQERNGRKLGTALGPPFAGIFWARSR